MKGPRRPTLSIAAALALLVAGSFGIAQRRAQASGGPAPDPSSKTVLHATVGDGGSDSAVTYLDVRFDDGMKVMVGGPSNAAFIQKLKEFADSHQTVTLTLARGTDDSSR